MKYKLQVMSKRMKIALFCMSALYILAGINHFITPLFYKKMMPPWLPAHDLLIQISGVAEILLGLLLLPLQTRPRAAWGIIVLLIAVFPANVQMMVNYRQEHHPGLWIAVLRLPIQLLLIRWAYYYAKKK